MVVREGWLIGSLQSRGEDPFHGFCILHYLLLDIRRIYLKRLWRGGLEGAWAPTLLLLVEHVDALPHRSLLGRPLMCCALRALAWRGLKRIPLGSCFLSRIDCLIEAISD